MKYKEIYIAGNYSKGKKIIPVGVVLHHTGLYSLKSIISTFTNPKSLASAHVLIGKDGNRIKFGEDNFRMWHAGISEFKGKKYCNNFMLGVEFHGDTNISPLSFEQVESFVEWLIPRIEKWNIKKDWITDHRTVSPKRKVDLKETELKKILTAIKYLF